MSTRPVLSESGPSVCWERRESTDCGLSQSPVGGRPPHDSRVPLLVPRCDPRPHALRRLSFRRATAFMSAPRHRPAGAQAPRRAWYTRRALTSDRMSDWHSRRQAPRLFAQQFRGRRSRRSLAPRRGRRPARQLGGTRARPWRPSEGAGRPRKRKGRRARPSAVTPGKRTQSPGRRARRRRCEKLRNSLEVSWIQMPGQHD
jgi:hypothetical protein